MDFLTRSEYVTKIKNYKDWTWDQLISNGFSIVIQLNVCDLNPSIVGPVIGRK
jgi:hypothetical protein